MTGPNQQYDICDLRSAKHDTVIAWLLVTLLLSLPTYGSDKKDQILLRVDIRLPHALNQEVIQAIHRDSNGFLWTGTQSALYKYDGISLVKFGPSETGSRHLRTNVVSAITEDNLGRVIIGTREGSILRWSKSKHKFEPLTSFIDEKYPFVRALHFSEQSHLWVVSKDTVLVIDENDSVVASWSTDDISEIVAHEFFGITVISENQVAIGITNGIAIIDSNSQKMEKIRIENSNIQQPFQVTAISSLETSQLIIGTNTGHVASIDLPSRKLREVRKLPSSGPTFISNLLVSNSQILIGSDHGLYQANFDLDFLFQTGPVERDGSLYDTFSLLQDKQVIWIGTFNGLVALAYRNSQPSKLSHHFTESVSAITEDLDRNLWIGTHNGLYRRDEKQSKNVRVGDTSNHSEIKQLVDQRVSAITYRQGKIWIGTLNGPLQTYDLNLGIFSTIDLFGLSAVEVPDLVYVKHWDEIWVATNRHGLFRIKDGEHESFLKNGSFEEKQVIRLFPLSSGNLLALNYNGVFLFDRGSQSFRKINFIFEGEQWSPLIYSLMESSDGNIWVGTDQYGLFQWKNANTATPTVRLVRASSSTDLDQSTLYDLLQDQVGNIWASTKNGILKLDINGNFLQRFTTLDGSQDKDFTWGASHKGQDGALYFAGINGYNKFYPEKIKIDNTPPRTILSAVHYPNKSFINIPAPQDAVSFEVSYKDHFVTFEFSASDFVGYQENLFRYKLEGFDPVWRENGSVNRATYTNLPPGAYVLRAQSANAAGNWDPDGLSLSVRVLPPPWRSWWAYCIYTIAGLLCLWAAHRVYQSYIIERKAEEKAQEMTATLEYAEGELQEQLEFQDEVLKSAYDHKRDTLALVAAVIDGPSIIEGHGVEDGAKLLRALSVLEDCIFYDVDGASADLNKYAELLLPKLLEGMPFGPHSVILINRLPTRVIPAPCCSMLAAILFETLDNCVQHAFDPKLPVHYISLELEEHFDSKTHSSLFVLTVADDGAGAPSGLFEHPTPGSGAANILAIVEKFEGKLELSTNPGTKIRITLPEGETSVRT